MGRTILIIGPHSAVRESLIDTLKVSQCRVLTISRKLCSKGSLNYQVNGLSAPSLPDIEENIDGLVYFPDKSQLSPHNKMTLEDYKRDMEVNFFAASSCVNKYTENLKKSSYGSIVFVSTIALIIEKSSHIAISGAKGALEGYARALAAELAPKTSVNVVAPPITNSYLTKHLRSPDEKIENFERNHSFEKIGEPEDIVSSIEFLLSERSSFITGKVIRADEGHTALKI